MPFDLAPSHASTCALGTSAECGFCPAARHCLIRGVLYAGLRGSGYTVALSAVGKTLFEAGTPAAAIYVVRAGCLKSFTMDDDGNERVRAFYLPGDFIGLDALGASAYPSTVVAVVPSQVCRVPAAQIHKLVAPAPGLMRGLLERTSRDLAQALALAGDYTAEQRVAAFLLAMQQRLGGSAARVTLPMTRRDIANYLRLATETVCRVLTRFEELSRIRSEGKSVELINRAALGALAGPVNLGASGLACAA